jgi:hypothetical protein
MSRRVTLMVVVLTSVIAAGVAVSAQSAKLKTSWAAPGVAPLNFAGKKVVALALVSDTNVKMSAEEALAREITSRGPQGVPAYRAIPKEELADKERAQAWFAKTGVAGVVTLRVVNVDRETQYSSVIFGASYYQSFSSFYEYGTATIVPIGSPKEKATYAIETLLYDVGDGGKLLWGGMSETTDPKNIQTFVQGLAKTVGADLEKQGLVVKKK